MKSLEKSWRCEGSASGVRRGPPQPPNVGRVSTGLGRSVARYRSASDSPRLIARVSGLSPSSESDSVRLARVGARYLAGSSAAAGGSGARDAMLVLTTGRSAGGEARRGGDGAIFHGSVDAGGVPGEVPGTADCYGHCWNSGNVLLVKQ